MRKNSFGEYSFEDTHETVEESRIYNLEVKQEYLKNSNGYTIIPTEIMKAKELGSSEKILYSILLGYIRKRGGGRCNPSIKRLSDDSGLCVSQVKNCLNSLKKNYWITWTRTKCSSNFRLFSPRDNKALIENAPKVGVCSVFKILKSKDSQKLAN